VRITVFGASGRTGSKLIQQALARGQEVVAFVRDGSKVRPRERLILVEGDARDPAAVERAIAGSDAVISVLSLPRPEDEPAYSEATRIVVEAAERAGARRIVLTANNTVFSDRELTGEFAPVGREHRRNVETVRRSSLDWTVGAAPWVVDDPGTGSYEAVADAKGPGKRIPTSDFATFLLDALQRDDWVGRIVGVSAPA
jgi:putative NADH-flavin reductase